MLEILEDLVRKNQRPGKPGRNLASYRFFEELHLVRECGVTVKQGTAPEAPTVVELAQKTAVPRADHAIDGRRMKPLFAVEYFSAHVQKLI